jgi:ribosomal protein S18 acetylase RimI-like enzyme
MTPLADISVRRATRDDLPALGRLGALLLNVHYAFDRDRFMAPGDDPEGGYAWFLGTQLEQPDVLVLVAVRGADIVGYLYAGIEPQNWKELRERAAFVHDIVVSEATRGQGVAPMLMTAAFEWMRQQNAPRVMLWTASQNSGAQRLFERLGFRNTMLEMTREL